MRITSPTPNDLLGTTDAFSKKDKVSTNVNVIGLNPLNRFPVVTSEIAVKKLNEFMEMHNKNLKFVYHEGLKEYYVTIIDSETEEVIKEIPPKKLLDAYYQMSKIIGNAIDGKI